MKKRKEFTGTVVSIKMKDTIVVSVERMKKHPLYRKAIRRSRNFVAHVENGMTVAEGDFVKIAEIPPVSKTKHFVLVGIVQK